MTALDNRVSLWLFAPPHGTVTSQGRLRKFERYRHTIRRLGGYWDASFSIFDDADLTTRWWNRLAYRLNERSGGDTTWQGIVWEVERTRNGAKWRKTLGDTYNALRCLSTDVTGKPYDTKDSVLKGSGTLTIDSRGFATDAESIAMFGRRELVFTLEGVEPTEADSKVTTELTRAAFPHPQPAGFSRGAADSAYVQLVGEIFTLNNQYVTDTDTSVHAAGTCPSGGSSTTIVLAASSNATDDYFNSYTITLTGGTGSGETNRVTDYVGATQTATVANDWVATPDATTTYTIDNTLDVSEYIRLIIAADSEYLSVGRIDDNTLQTRKVADGSFVLAWDKIQELVNLGDASGNPYVLYVKPGGKVYYEAANATPRYEWRGDKGFVTRYGSINPWAAWPHVVRDLTTKRALSPTPGSHLTDGRDAWITEVEMATGQEQPHMKPDGFDPEELNRAKEINARWLQHEAASGGQETFQEGGATWGGIPIIVTNDPDGNKRTGLNSGVGSALRE